MEPYEIAEIFETPYNKLYEILLYFSELMSNLGSL